VPLLAVIVTIDVPAGVPPVGPGLVDGLPPHPGSKPALRIPASTTITHRSFPRKRRGTENSVSPARHTPQSPLAKLPNAPGLTLVATVPAVVVIVIAVVTAPPAGVTDAGAKAQVDSAGSPEHANVTGSLIYPWELCSLCTLQVAPQTPWPLPVFPQP
jgi:hypothetical protein